MKTYFVTFSAFNALARVALFSLTFCTLSASAQQPSPNADIVKMIEAGLPEGIVVNKIQDGAGRWDTSIDALILLKKIGATEAELKALAAAPAVDPTAVTAENPGVPLLGGRVTNQNGIVILHVPTSDDPNSIEITLQLVLIDNRPALKFTTEAIGPKDINTYGDLIFNHDGVRYMPYINAGAESHNPFPRWTLMYDHEPITFSYADVSPSYNKYNEYLVSEDYVYVKGKGFTFTTFWRPTRLSKKMPWHFRLGEAYAQSISSIPARDTLNAIFRNFDETLASVLQAAKITDATSQLSSSSHFRVPSVEGLQEIIRKQNAVVAERQRVFDLLGKNAVVPEDKGSGGIGWLSALNALQSVANMQQAMSDAKVADATHNGAAQMQVAISMGKAEVQTISAVSDPNAAPIQAAAPSPLSQQAQAQQQAQLQAKIAAANAHSSPTAAGASPFHYVPAQQNAGAKFSPNTGTAAAPTCVYLSDAQPCVPLAQWQQMQAQQPSAGTKICPASGFVPGVMIKTASDVAEGVPCKPGTPYGPVIATTASGGFTGVTPPDSASSGSAPGSGANGGSGPGSAPWANPDGYDDAINQCITISHKADPVTGDHMTLTNSCQQTASVYWYVTSRLTGGAGIAPGATENTYKGWPDILAAGGDVKIWACPANDTPQISSGAFAPGSAVSPGYPDQPFRCAKP